MIHYIKKTVLKAKGFHNKTIQRGISNTLFVLFIPLFILLLIVLPWYHSLLMIFMTVFLTKIGSSIGFHRYFSHKSFEVEPWKEWVFAIAGTLATTLTVFHYTVGHGQHHKESDTDLDVHSPGQLNVYENLFLIMPEQSAKALRRLEKDKWVFENKAALFSHNWFYFIIFGWILFLGLINPLLILTCYAIPAGHALWSTLLSRWPMHVRSIGYRNFDLPDDSINSTFLNYLSLGEGLHNNHHRYPRSYTHNSAGKKGEWDCVGWVIKHLLMKKKI
jgi:fatty-acid desaturase